MFARVGSGLALGLGLNAIVVGGLCFLVFAWPRLLIALGLWGRQSHPALELLVLGPTLLGTYGLPLFSGFQLLYLVPLGVGLGAFPRTRPMALGLTLASAITLLLNGLCVGAGTAWALWALSRPGAIH